jgi:hypothetical protein
VSSVAADGEIAASEPRHEISRVGGSQKPDCSLSAARDHARLRAGKAR